VIGDGNAAMFSQVTFWGAQWWMDNSLSGGLAPASFTCRHGDQPAHVRAALDHSCAHLKPTGAGARGSES
jgi:hypothetical protein